MPQSTRTGSYYEVLGARPEATQEELKRAYFRAVRAHPPERDPEGFQRLREAWETLSDPRARRQYDAMQQHGGEIQLLMEQGEALVQAEDFAAAARTFRRILVLSPELEAARTRLGFCHLRLGEFAEAAKQFDRLCRAPSATYLSWAAQTRCTWALHDEGRAAALQEEAIRLFVQAIGLDPVNAEPYLGLARLHHRRDEHDVALQYVEKAIAADGRVDFQDFEALYLACVIHLSRDDVRRFEETLGRLDALSPDLEQRRYVGWHFAKSSWDAARAGAFVAAGHLAGAALRFAPEESWLKEFQQLAEVSREFARISDEQGFLKMLLALELQIAVADEAEGAELQAQWRQALELLPRVHPRFLVEWGATLKSRCPAFYRRNRELVDQMARVGGELAPVLREAERAMADALLPKLLQAVAALVHDATLDAKPEHSMHFGRAHEAAATFPASVIRGGVSRVRTEYPALYRAQQGIWDGLVGVAGTRQPMAAAPADQGSGCGCLILAILGALAAGGMG